MDPPEDATEIIVDVNFTSLLGADADAFIVQPTQLVFDSMDVQNITVSFGALPLVAGKVGVQEPCCAGDAVREAACEVSCVAEASLYNLAAGDLLPMDILLSLPPFSCCLQPAVPPPPAK